jgi:hypothetical protein
LIEVYVDDFIAFVIAMSAEQLENISNAVMQGIHDIFPPNNNEEEDLISNKELQWGDSMFDAKKYILGFTFDGENKTIWLKDPPLCQGGLKIAMVMLAYRYAPPAHNEGIPFPCVVGGCSFFKSVTHFQWRCPSSNISARRRGGRRTTLITSGRGHHGHFCLPPPLPPPPSPCGGTSPTFQHCATGRHHWQWSHSSMHKSLPQPQPHSLSHGRRLCPNAAASPHRPPPSPIAPQVVPVNNGPRPSTCKDTLPRPPPLPALDQ